MRLFIIAIVFISIYSVHTGASSIFACDFEDGTICQMNIDTSPVNFTVATGETLSDKTLGPMVDHTLKTSSGHFLYWYRSAQQVRVRIDGLIDTPALPLQPNLCLNFAYYIKSISTPDKLTALAVALIGCSQGLIWSVKIIDSSGWQTVEAHLPSDTCTMMLSFFVSSNATEGVSVPIDDITVDTCRMPTPTTTTVSTTTFTSSSTVTLTTLTTSMTTASLSTSTSLTPSTTTSMTSTITSPMTTITPTATWSSPTTTSSAPSATALSSYFSLFFIISISFIFNSVL